jgi:hypothetical protein
VTARAHARRSEYTPEGHETGIAADPLAQSRMSDQAKADRRQGGTENTARDRVKNARGHHHRKNRPQRERERACAHGHECDGGNEARRSHGIDQRAPRHLPCERDQSAHGQDKADVDLRPRMRREIDSDEGAETCLNVGHEKCEPVETAFAAASFRCRRSERRARSRRKRLLRRLIAIDPTGRVEGERGQCSSSGGAGGQPAVTCRRMHVAPRTGFPSSNKRLFARFSGSSKKSYCLSSALHTFSPKLKNMATVRNQAMLPFDCNGIRHLYRLYCPPLTVP